MLVAKSSTVTSATPESIWKIWTDVKNWSTWDRDVAYCEMNENFQTGAKAVLKPTSGPRVNIEIIECTAMKSFITKGTLFFGTSLIFKHKITQVDEGLKITHKVELQGCLAPLFYCLLGPSIQQGLPIALQNLAEKAKKIE
ncbi:MAG: hypothetical protein L0207_05565 [Chlamydiae bacterium]|nr:hypothetical protein [Chlamydiota bacterium]